MNFKLWSVTSVALAIAAAAGCGPAQNPAQPTGGGLSGDEGDSSGDTLSGGGLGGSMGSGSGTPSAAKQYYIDKVHPLMVSMNNPAASCTGCHATGASAAPIFMDNEAEKCYAAMDAYSGLITKPDDSQLLLHGKHTGPSLSLDQRTEVTNWLTMEAQERGLDGSTGSSMSGGAGGSTGTGMTPPPTLSVKDSYIKIGKCMLQTDWTGNNLPLLATQQTASKGPCTGCHSGGEGGMYLDAADENQTFLMQQVLPGVKRWVTPEYVSGKFTGKMLPNPRPYLKGDNLPPCDNTPGAICHPPYKLTPQMHANIDKFIDLTVTRFAQNLCPP